ncbi:MAG: class I SAM-dependent methyltransferase [Terriglobales bacterium]
MKAAGFLNCYQDMERAEAYSKLEFARTYYLAYRDLPEIFKKHAQGRAAIDFGCGAGRSTRFLRKCGFDAVGIDISEQMTAKARKLDPGGDYRLIQDGDLSQFNAAAYSLVLCAFTFDNIAMGKKIALFRGLGSLLNREGRLVNLVSSPEIYVNEWASFSTKDFPENRFARSGDVVRIITTDCEDRRPVEDIICTDEAYQEIYREAGLQSVAAYKPLATGSEPYEWVSETRIAPWVIYVLKSA